MIYPACIDYQGMYSNELSFSEGEQLEIYEKKNSFWWKGKSLVSGDKGFIPSSCVYSMLESLQLLEFILSVEEVSLPILQKIRNDSSSNDEKASLFLETINDDPIMIPALRQDKEQHHKSNNCDYCDSQYCKSAKVISAKIINPQNFSSAKLKRYTVFKMKLLSIYNTCVYVVSHSQTPLVLPSLTMGRSLAM